GEQAFAEDDFRALQAQAFHEGGVARGEDVADEIGMIEEVEIESAETQGRRVAVFASEAGQKLERAVLQRADGGGGEPGAWAGRSQHAMMRAMMIYEERASKRKATAAALRARERTISIARLLLIA